MFKAYGLQTHIWGNNWKSLLLLAGFPVLLMLLTYALFLLYAGLVAAGGYDPAVAANPFVWAAERLATAWPYALVAAGLWFAVAYAFYQNIIDASTGARPLDRADNPALYNMLENLSISRGMKTPALRVMETSALNAYATGLHEGNYSVTVTRGLLNTLSKEEVEAVLAHELTHIRNRDVRLLIISIIFVGIFSFVGEMGFRALRGGLHVSNGGGNRGGRSDSNSGGGGGGAAIIAIVAALVIIAVAYALAVVIRFALSRKREYLADAGAVELTKNPDAMISALQKISGNAAVDGPPAEVREMFIENPHADFAGLFATHPPIAKRIAALEAYAGGRLAGPWVGAVQR